MVNMKYFLIASKEKNVFKKNQQEKKNNNSKII